MFELVQRRDGKVVINLRGRQFWYKLPFLLACLGGLIAWLAFGRGDLASRLLTWPTFALAGIPVFLLLIGSNIVLDPDARICRKGRAITPFSAIEAVGVYTRIRVSRSTSTRGHHRTRYYLDWHVNLIVRRKALPPGAGPADRGRAVAKVLRKSSREIPHEQAREIVAAFGERWTAAEATWHGLVTSTNANLVSRIAEVLAGTIGVPLLDLSGDRPAVHAPEDLDLPFVEKIRTGKVRPEPSGPRPAGVSESAAGGILRIDWSPNRIHPHRVMRILSMIIGTGVLITLAVVVSRFAHLLPVGALRIGALVSVGVFWIEFLLRRGSLTIDRSGVVWRDRKYVWLTRRMTLDELEMVRANPRLNPCLQLVSDRRILSVPMDRDAAAWFRRRIESHFADQVLDGLPPVAAAAKQPTRFPALAVGVGAGVAVLVVVFAVVLLSRGPDEVTPEPRPNPPARPVVAPEPPPPAPPQPAELDPPPPEEPKKPPIADKLAGRWRLSCTALEGPRAKRLQRTKLRRLKASLGGTVLLSKDGTYERRRGRKTERGSWRVDDQTLILASGREEAYRLAGWTEKGFVLTAEREGFTRIEIGAEPAPEEPEEAEDASWSSMGEYASRMVRSRHVEVELSRLRGDIRIRAELKLPKAMKRPPVRCDSDPCPVSVRFYGGRTFERASGSSRILTAASGSEQNGRLRVELDHREVCRRKPKFIGIALGGKGDIGGRLSGERTVVEAGEGLCFGASREIWPPVKADR